MMIRRKDIDIPTAQLCVPWMDLSKLTGFKPQCILDFGGTP